MPFVIGTRRAAIIDTGLALADLRKFLEQFNNLRIIVLNNHGHPDHAGANRPFDMSCIAKEAEQAMPGVNREKRLWDYKNMFMPGNDEMMAIPASMSSQGNGAQTAPDQLLSGISWRRK